MNKENSCNSNINVSFENEMNQTASGGVLLLDKEGRTGFY